MGPGGWSRRLRDESWLKGALDAQRETVTAQDQLVRTMDAPRMLERYEAYKKLVEHEKTAALTAKDQEMDNWHGHALEVLEAAHATQEVLVDIVMLLAVMLYDEQPGARAALLRSLGNQSPAARRLIEETITQIVAPAAGGLRA